MFVASSFPRARAVRVWPLAAAAMVGAVVWAAPAKAAWFGTSAAIDEAAVEQERQEREQLKQEQPPAEAPPESPPEAPSTELPGLGVPTVTGEHAENGATPAPHRGAVLEHLPAACSMLAYVDVAKLRALPPVGASRTDLVKAMALLGARHPRVASAIGRWSAALSKQGVDWHKDIGELALCMNGERDFTMSIAGEFADKDLAALADSAEKPAGGHVSVEEHDGRKYVQVGAVTAAQVAPGIVTLAPDQRALDATWEASDRDLPARGVANDAIGLFGFDEGGRHVVVEMREQGDSLVFTSTIKNEGEPCDPAADRMLLQGRLDAITGLLAQSPVAAMASDVGRSNMIVEGNTAAIRTVIPMTTAAPALQAAARMDPGLWDAALVAGAGWVRRAPLAHTPQGEAPAPSPGPTSPTPVP